MKLNSQSLLQSFVKSHVETVEKFFASHMSEVDACVDAWVNALTDGKKLLFCGNGGSACDAQHIAGEFVGRLAGDRKSLPALALNTDGGLMTAISNDYGYESVFSRQVEGLGQAGDIFVGISTSGNSANVLKALEVANKKGMVSVALLGRDGGKMKGMATHEFIVPNNDTARIQECHIMLLHSVCSLTEQVMGLVNPIESALQTGMVGQTGQIPRKQESLKLK